MAKYLTWGEGEGYQSLIFYYGFRSMKNLQEIYFPPFVQIGRKVLGKNIARKDAISSSNTIW